MLKRSISAAALVTVFAMALPVFAETSGLLLPAVQKVSDDTSNMTSGGPGGGPHVKREASAPSVSEIVCVGRAVSAREAALGASVSTHSQSVQAAYSTRATALNQAYMGTTTVQVKASVKGAWSSFNGSIKAATKVWKTAQKSAWATFKTAAKDCKAPAGVSDSANSSSEMSGQ